MQIQDPGLCMQFALQMLGPLAFDLKKTRIALWPLIAGCMQWPTATAARAL